MRAALVLPAAGSGTRFGGETPKQLLPLAGLPILRRSAEAFAGLVEEVIVPVSPALHDAVAAMLAPCAALFRVRLVPGGATRQDSVHAGLLATDDAIAVVLIHDAVRPLVPRRCIAECLAALIAHPAALVAVPCVDTVKRSGDQRSGDQRTVAATVPRQDLWLAQTPQGMQRTAALAAFARARSEGWQCSDDAQIMERAGFTVALVAGDVRNRKITTPDDLAVAEAILADGGRSERR